LVLAAIDWAVLQGLTIVVDALWDLSRADTFMYVLVAGLAAKVAGDVIYFVNSPGRRRWRYLDDYLLNDVLVHLRFVVPIAIAQGLLAVQGPLYAPGAWILLRPLVVSPLPGVIAWAINRSLTEEADEKQNRPLGTRAAGLGGPR